MQEIIEVRKRSEAENNNNKIRRRSLIAKKLMCFGSNNYGVETVDQVDENGNVDMTSANGGEGQKCPTHLVVMVNGLIGSAHNWRYAAKQFLKNYPEDIIVHCSERNSSLLTFNGVDVMGCRLANEVISVIKRHPNLQKISFIGHSLGGLIARYAIAKLYTNDTINNHGSESISSERIAGLVPINFITVATPHLGTGGHRQVPMFGGSNTVEKVAHQISWVLGRTGRHLFLTDKARGNPPLLLQMVNDCEDLKFFSALQSFKRHVTYANAHFDHIVGWSTSSIRRRNELPQRKQLVRSGKYPHILKGDVSTITQGSSIELKVNSFKTATASMEETMIRGLTKISWERVDVSFKGSKQRYFAHNTIQVNTPWMNSDGADIIQHIVDNFHL
ncbi:alpha/beta-Hydrolases superfamily protein [Artemisia annua]|uniref:Alpha/beta-Hydrolases superfamily protein n=1 Tax=Artemisia annua TaxID=35608 RepID=A0A2U1PBB7_ARTAN|nr:alpha/beta-Hydrolases superfamily protein [Artemisia annua]